MSYRLPFTPIEELMLHQDSRAYPYTVFIRLIFAGRFDQEAFEAAARDAIARHPLLTARVDRSRRRPVWRLDESVPLDINWREGEITKQFPSAEFLDAENDGMRLIVTRDELASDLVIQCLHARCDGVGIFQFIHDLLLLYAMETGASLDHEVLPKFDPSRLKGRGKFGLTLWKLLKMARKQAVGLLGARQFLMRSPTPIVPHDCESADAPTSNPYPTACAHHFDDMTSSAFRSAARELGVTTNDLLARDLFVALHKFRLKHEISEDESWLRLMIPKNLRNDSDDQMPAANVVSCVFLDRRGSDIADSEQLLASVNEEMKLIKSHQLGFTFIWSLHLNRLLPGGIRGAARSDECRSTAVFTNLGKILAQSPLPRDAGELVCGDVRLKKVELLAPVTPYTCAAFAVCWYADRLSITMHFDPRVLSSEDASELLEMLVVQINQSAGCSNSEQVKRDPSNSISTA